jgi:hypothetical protein
MRELRETAIPRTSQPSWMALMMRWAAWGTVVFGGVVLARAASRVCNWP